MRKLLSIALIIAATFAVGLAQEQGVSPQGANDSSIPNMGKAPTQPDGIGRADARIFDESPSETLTSRSNQRARMAFSVKRGTTPTIAVLPSCRRSTWAP